MWGYAFIETEWKLGNVLFYIYLLVSFIGFAYTLYRIWKNPIGIKID
jgi:hypothetical protein